MAPIACSSSMYSSFSGGQYWCTCIRIPCIGSQAGRSPSVSEGFGNSCPFVCLHLYFQVAFSQPQHCVYPEPHPHPSAHCHGHFCLRAENADKLDNWLEDGYLELCTYFFWTSTTTILSFAFALSALAPLWLRPVIYFRWVSAWVSKSLLFEWILGKMTNLKGRGGGAVRMGGQSRWIRRTL